MRVLTHFLLWHAGLAPAETQTSDAERARLVRHAANRKRLVEIGVWHGVTTQLLRAAMAPDGILYAVDPFPPGRLRFSAQRYIAHREVDRVKNGTVRWEQTTGDSMAQQYRARNGDPVDFIFIDGDHSYRGLEADWTAWHDLVAVGGVVGLHDSRPTDARPIGDAGSVRFTDEVIARDPLFERIDAVDTLTIVRRRAAP